MVRLTRCQSSFIVSHISLPDSVNSRRAAAASCSQAVKSSAPIDDEEVFAILSPPKTSKRRGNVALDDDNDGFIPSEAPKSKKSHGSSRESPSQIPQQHVLTLDPGSSTAAVFRRRDPTHDSPSGDLSRTLPGKVSSKRQRLTDVDDDDVRPVGPAPNIFVPVRSLLPETSKQRGPQVTAGNQALRAYEARTSKAITVIKDVRAPPTISPAPEGFKSKQHAVPAQEIGTVGFLPANETRSPSPDGIFLTLLARAEASTTVDFKPFLARYTKEHLLNTVKTECARDEPGTRFSLPETGEI